MLATRPLILLALLVLLVLPVAMAGRLAADTPTSPPSIDWLAGKHYTEAVEQPVVASWENAELREALRALAEQRRIPIMLDRRLDPNRRFQLTTRGEPLRQVCSQLVQPTGGSLSDTGQLLYLGPTPAAHKLRTLIALRTRDLREATTDWPDTPRKALTRKQEIAWDDLATPREIARQIAEKHAVSITNTDLLPHDLWAGQQLPAISLAESLSVVLIQFDLTFAVDNRQSPLELTLIPVPEEVRISRDWKVPQARREAVLKAIASELPDLAPQFRGDRLEASGTDEELEQLSDLITSVVSGRPRQRPTADPVPLARRQVTFQAQNVPLQAVMDKLTASGIQFQYDAQALRAAKIDLNQTVNVSVQNASFPDLFDQLFPPHGLLYELDELTVTLTPAPATR